MPSYLCCLFSSSSFSSSSTRGRCWKWQLLLCIHTCFYKQWYKIQACHPTREEFFSL